ncbi:hypothetical protein [Sulfurisoma sediminicola]|uniref:Uncharacterized protein n=1 Tax=Sulfurisoma sediminicola TaxID=1381557 RepID=A0A497XDK3_9PROT|nr:hypothetical protein [Sulfurisoma sediminicola]RLJ64769.1 hypothetical protein DFR35_1416 [Sulfurisoma sediminicola]
MAKYRPISPEQAWRSTRSTGLDPFERYVELYLLSSPFSNAIGCFRFVLRIAAAEIGMSCEDLLATISRLEQKGIVLVQGDFVLVRTWFFHNFWDSTFVGNVAKAASREAAELPPAIHSQWTVACVEAGVPADVISKFSGKPLQSPLEQTNRGLSNNNRTEPQPDENKTTTITSPLCSGGENSFSLVLLPIGEPHRRIIESSLVGIDSADAQAIADEVCGALEAADKGRRKPILGLHGWIPALVESFKSGSFVPQWGPKVAQERERTLTNAEKERSARVEVAQEEERQKQARCSATALLQSLSETDLHEFIRAIEPQVKLPKLLPAIRDSILRREVPQGLGGSIVVSASRTWSVQPGARP